MAVDEEGEAYTLMVVLAILVPDDGENVTSVADAVEAEVRPCILWQERIDDDAAVNLGTEAADASDDEVVISGVVVVAGTLAVTHQPGTSFLVEIFADVGAATVMLALSVELHLAEEHGVANNRIRIVVHIVSQRRQRLTSSEGPDGSVPFTLTHAVGTELRVTALSCGEAVRGRKALFVFYLKPCFIMNDVLAVRNHI